MGTNNEKNVYPPLEEHPLMTGGYGQGKETYLPPPGYPPGPPQHIPFPPGPVLNQPTAQGVAPGNMQVPSNFPPGLEYLSMIDQLIVKQKVELLEAFTGFETKNKYVVTNSLGQKIFFAGEESDCLTRNCCGNVRPFDMKIIDNFGNQVINLHRPLACQSCCFPCCLQSMEVTSPPGTIIGTIEQEWSICTPLCATYAVKNPTGDTMLRLQGPCCLCRCCADVNFKILSADGANEIGKISKHWSGIVKEALTDVDNFGISFPMNLDVKMKATLLGALFLIDMIYFEDNE